MKTATQRKIEPDAEALSDPAPSRVPLPKTVTDVLPRSVSILRGCEAMEGALAELLAQMDGVRRRGDAIKLARAFVAMHRVDAVLTATTKAFYDAFSQYKQASVPGIFDDVGVTSIPLDDGFRVGTSYKVQAAIRTDARDKAFAWLRDNKMGSLITETVSASTLSATARTMREGNVDLPDDLFSVVEVPNTSVTKIKTR